MNIIFFVSIFPREGTYRNAGLMFFLLSLIPVTIQAETVYITDSLLVGLHEEKSIHSAILKLIPTGTALEIISRDDDFVHVRDPKGVSGWINNSYLITNNPDKNQTVDAGAAQSEIRMQRAKSNQEYITNSAEIAKLKTANEKLRQQAKSDKLKSGALQAELIELKNKLSKSKNSNKLNNEIQLITEKNIKLENEIKQLQKGENAETPVLGNRNIFDTMITVGVALLFGFLVGIFLMNWKEKQRYGGLKH